MSVEGSREVMMRALEGHDARMLGPHAVFPIRGTGEVARGREAIGRLANSFYHGIFEAQSELKDLLIAGGQACFEAELVGRQVSEVAGIAPSGEEIRVPLCVVYELAHDLIMRGRIYFGTDALRKPGQQGMSLACT